MECNQVKEKLPEYLAGVLDTNTANEIRVHIENCKSCGKEAEELTGTEPLPVKNNQEDVRRVLKKTRRRFQLNIVRTVIAVAAVLWALYMLPAVLWGIQSLNQGTASRALMDAVQFSQPNKVNFWGNSAVDRLSLSVPLKIGTRPMIGKKFGGQQECTGGMSVINGKVTAPPFLGAGFLHPGLFKGVDLGRDRDPEIQKTVLGKNAETSVATVDYSLNKLIGLPDAGKLLDKYDVEICWMAVEAGIENVKPKNMTFGNQQVLQWGIPGRLSKPGSFDYAVFSKGNAGEYEKAVMEEMKWLDKNKAILAPDAGLLGNNGISSAVEEKAAYVIKNGIRIYGLRITGPSSELLKLAEELEPRALTVVDMDFWNW